MDTVYSLLSCGDIREGYYEYLSVPGLPHDEEGRVHLQELAVAVSALLQDDNARKK